MDAGDCSQGELPASVPAAGRAGLAGGGVADLAVEGPLGAHRARLLQVEVHHGARPVLQHLQGVHLQHSRYSNFHIT